MIQKHHDVLELKNIHKGQRAFILGNGYSAMYYDSEKMAMNGTLIGCNRAFEVHPLTYLIFQDRALANVCGKFTGIKICPYRKALHEHLDSKTTFYVNFVKHSEKDSFDFTHSGGLALQIACFMGFDEILLVGCDCCFLDSGGGKLTSNIFEDKHYKRIAGKPHTQKKAEKRNNGVTTVGSLERFAKIFKSIYNKNKGAQFIRKMGHWGIVDIPHIEYEGFWTDYHPERAAHYVRTNRG
uniref:DUF115 domain-containing protein n=1 Tax=viral metagenome TaxID=1070528 RepID=A0A6M3L5P9_9ZZZZ